MRRGLIRIVMTTADRVRRLWWRLGGRPGDGVRAIVLTPENRIVLVRQTYTQGWLLPAGGKKRGEPLEAAIVRELREEIGFHGGTVVQIEARKATLGRRPHHLTTFVVRDAVYSPRPNLEIEEVAEFPIDAPPPDLGSSSRDALKLLLSMR
jgi:8-oxo-dGTP pyrophosphatase MutT (NUDIX family)